MKQELNKNLMIFNTVGIALCCLFVACWALVLAKIEPLSTFFYSFIGISVFVVLPILIITLLIIFNRKHFNYNIAKTIDELHFSQQEKEDSLKIENSAQPMPEIIDDKSIGTQQVINEEIAETNRSVKE